MVFAHDLSTLIELSLFLCIRGQWPPSALSRRISAFESNYDWEKDSLLYKRVGWSMFGSGLLVGGVIGGAMLGNAIHENKRMNGEGIGALGHGITNIMFGYVGIGIMAVGGAVMLSGIGVLIAESVKFDPYRSGEIAGHKFEWNPELYVSPEFNGVGFSARF